MFEHSVGCGCTVFVAIGSFQLWRPSIYVIQKVARTNGTVYQSAIWHLFSFVSAVLPGIVVNLPDLAQWCTQGAIKL